MSLEMTDFVRTILAPGPKEKPLLSQLSYHLHI